MPSGWARPAALTILIAFLLLLLGNAVPASGADPEPPPCKTAGQFDPANFPNPPKIDNQWNPLAPGMQVVLAGEADGGNGLLPHRAVSTVTDLTKVVNGVAAVVILKTDFNEGVLEASELAFQAQDNAGDLWSLGEFPAQFEDNGEFKGAPDTWISGLSHAEPGNLMLGDPQLEIPEYLQGWSPDIDFLGCAKVYKMQQKTCVPVGCYDNVLITEEWSPLEPESGRHRKYYAPGVGNVRVSAVGGFKEEALVLAEVSQLSPEDLAKVRKEALELEQTAYEVSAVYRQTSPSVLTTEPSLEPTEPESTGPPVQKPSIEIANAPIGGNGGQGPRACAEVNWLGTKPIPDGIMIKVGSIHLEPEGIFELDQGSCSGDRRSCAGLEWKGGDPPACHVGAKQVSASETDNVVLVILAVTVTCKHQADCDSLAADPENSGGSSISFEPDPDFESESESPSESPSSESPSESPSSESPSESPSEAPSESPAESPSNG